MTAGRQDQREEFVFVYEEDKRPVVILLGWAGCQDRYLAKYSAIYEEKRYIYREIHQHRVKLDSRARERYTEACDHRSPGNRGDSRQDSQTG